MAVRPANLLPPKRLSTPRSARRVSTTNRGLLLGAPVPTQTGLAPASPTQLSRRTMRRDPSRPYGQTVGRCAVQTAVYLRRLAGQPSLPAVAVATATPLRVSAVIVIRGVGPQHVPGTPLIPPLGRICTAG